MMSFENLSSSIYSEKFPWAFFDGVSKGTPTKGGVEGIIHLDEDTIIFFATSLSEASNNFSEFMVVKLLFLLATERGISHINIYWDSMLVINCMNGT
jgi:ribonuclease HI